MPIKIPEVKPAKKTDTTAKKRKRTELEGGDDNDEDHLKKKIKTMISKVSIPTRKIIVDEIIEMCIIEDDQKTNDIFFGKDIQELVNEKIREFDE